MLTVCHDDCKLKALAHPRDSRYLGRGHEDRIFLDTSEIHDRRLNSVEGSHAKKLRRIRVLCRK